MVYNSVSQTEAPSLPEAKPPMASSAFSANSQSLDNFTPIELNWSINQSNSLLFRTLSDPTHLTPTHNPEFPPFSPLLNDHIRSHQSEFLPVSPLNDQLRPHQSEAPPFYFGKNDHLRSHQSDVPPVSLVKNDQLQSRRLGDSVQSSELCYAFSSPSESQVIKLGASLRFLFSDAFESKDRNGTLCEGKKSDLSLSEKPLKKRVAATDLDECLEKKPAEDDCSIENQEEKLIVADKNSKKILIRIEKAKAASSDDKDYEEKKPSGEMVEEPEPAHRAWNLRPRRPVTMPPKANGGVDKPLGQNQPELAPSGGPAEAKVTMPEKRQKPKRFSLALTKEEIQEDFFAITGSKPPRRPKRRAKNVQKNLEGIFPGMYLMSVTTAAYRVPDPPLKA